MSQNILTVMGEVNITAVCFDLGGVLVRLCPGFEIDLLGRALSHESEILKQHLRDEFRPGRTEYSTSERYQLGLISTDEYIATIADALSGRVSRDEILSSLMQEIAGDYPDVALLLPELSTRYKLGCFSNTNAMHWDHINQQFDWMRYFEVKQASHLIGIAKPSAQAFERLCKDLGTNPASCVFIDDRQINVESANAFGMRGLLYTNLATLKRDLSALGVSLGRVHDINQS